MTRTALLSLGALLLGLVAQTADAATNTPLEWQHLVLSHTDRRFIGQQKHTNWVRDRNQNFIDDLLDSLRTTRDTVDIVLELNTFMAPIDIHAQFDAFGRITYIPKLVSGVIMDGVAVARLDSLASHPRVAMVEWQTPNLPMLDVSARAVQARRSVTYSAANGFGSAEDRNMLGADAGGSAVNIAILDSGVFDSHDSYAGHLAFGSVADAVCTAGFDATKFEDTTPSNFKDDSWEDHCSVCADPTCATCTDPIQDEPGDGGTDPDPQILADHGTHVAGIALARDRAGASSRTPGVTAVYGGVAPQAKLIDVKVCTSNNNCSDENVEEGLDWIGLNAAAQNIKVANISIGDEYEDNGKSHESETVNFVVALGVSVVVAHGNATTAHPQGSQLTGAPGSASFAITVAGTNDMGTVSRSDDTIFPGNLIGPRTDYDPMAPNPNFLARKPDIAAPAGGAPAVQQINTTAFTGSPPSTDAYTPTAPGTSLASPHVAAAAAILRGAWPTMDPGSVKDLLMMGADRSRSGGATWDPAFGSGILNVFSAIRLRETSPGGDVRFENCVGPAGTPGTPCALPPGIASWNNHLDITTAPWPPQVGIETTITAKVRNDGSPANNVLVNFGVYNFGIPGRLLFQHIGSWRGTIAAWSTFPAELKWKPKSAGHQCVQVSIQYALDSNYLNNVTQRNLQVSASEYDMEVGNPFTVPAYVHLVATSDRKGWDCRVDSADFTLDPFQDPPRKVRISFHAPKGALPGQRANCNVAAYAKKAGGRDSTLVGGVTVQTFVPEPCRLVGKVVDSRGRPVQGAHLRFSVKRPHGTIRPAWERDRTATTDQDGAFSLRVLPSIEQKLSIYHPRVGRGEVTVRPKCGEGKLRVELSRSGVRVLGAR